MLLSSLIKQLRQETWMTEKKDSLGDDNVKELTDPLKFPSSEERRVSHHEVRTSKGGIKTQYVQPSSTHPSMKCLMDAREERLKRR